MWKRHLRISGYMVAAIGGLLSIMTVGGCPVAQTPTVLPGDQDSQNESDPPSTNEPDNVLPRPIPPVDLDTTTSGDEGTTGGNNSSGGSSSSGGGSGSAGGGSSKSPVLLRVDEPALDLRVRPGVVVPVVFDLTDVFGAVAKTEIVAARDENADGEADGSPVFAAATSTATGTNTVSFNTTGLASKLNGGVGRFVFGIRVTTKDDEVTIDYSPATVTVDEIAPTIAWIAPTDDLLANREGTIDVQVTTADNSSHTVTINLVPTNGTDPTFPAATANFASGAGARVITIDLAAVPIGAYTYQAVVTDNASGPNPPASVVAMNPATSAPSELVVTDRIVGEFDLASLASTPPTGTASRGAIFQGFNFNDLAGSSMSKVPSLNDDNGDGEINDADIDDLLIASRLGKPFLIQTNGVGFGEAYMIYGDAGRLSGEKKLNAVGLGNVPGVVLPGIRSPLNTRWTEGMSDITVIDDMDGDNLPEMVFSFPRTESLNLGDGSALQHPELVPDLPGMGSLEYNANSPFGWVPNTAQFTRGGVVIVSSHNRMLADPSQVNRKFNRTLDLHEVGQMFGSMSGPSTELYVNNVVPNPFDPFGCQDCIICTNCDPNCEPPVDPNTGEEIEPEPEGAFADCMGIPDNCAETFYNNYIYIWDTVFNNQGPGGFHQPWTATPANPPLANAAIFPYSQALLDIINPPASRCDDLDGDFLPDGCEFINIWMQWGPPPFVPFPCTTLIGINAWDVGGGVNVWTGFYGPETSPRSYTASGSFIPATSIGARILGQAVNDHFGASVASDGTWLYISAPNHTAAQADVPSLPTMSRSNAGVIYQLRTNAKGTPNGPTLTQLWLENGTRQIPGENPNDPPIDVALAYPYLDAEVPTRVDFTIPVPHQYIIESVGSLRGDSVVFEAPEDDPDAIQFPFVWNPDGQNLCPPAWENGAARGAQAPVCGGYKPYPSPSSGDFVDRTPQIVGPHTNAQIRRVQAMGDINGDGYNDFAVGSANILQDVFSPGGASNPTVGAVFVVYSRAPGVEGDYLLEQLALDPTDQARLEGVMIRGAGAGETLARVFADAGDFNGDGYADVVIGNEGANTNTGEVVVLLGSPTLLSPAGGWTPATIPEGRSIRFVGATPGDLVGANVAGAGDVDGDGISDILISAPGATTANGQTGAVYLVYGTAFDEPNSLESRNVAIRLTDVGTTRVQGVRFIGRHAGDQLGAGSKAVAGTNPNPGQPDITAASEGLSSLGDIDGDGVDDFAISAMLADPAGKTDAGEVYILYGKRGRNP